MNNNGLYDGNGTDDYDFSALPGGLGNSDGSFDNVGYRGYWWSASEDNGGYAWSRGMGNNSDVYRDNENKSFLFSVRCVRD